MHTGDYSKGDGDGMIISGTLPWLSLERDITVVVGDKSPIYYTPPKAEVDKCLNCPFDECWNCVDNKNTSKKQMYTEFVFMMQNGMTDDDTIMRRLSITKKRLNEYKKKYYETESA